MSARRFRITHAAVTGRSRKLGPAVLLAVIRLKGRISVTIASCRWSLLDTRSAYRRAGDAWNSMAGHVCRLRAEYWPNCLPCRSSAAERFSRLSVRMLTTRRRVVSLKLEQSYRFSPLKRGPRLAHCLRPGKFANPCPILARVVRAG